MSPVETLLVFVGIPVGLFAVITALALAPGVVSGPRYRPGLSWWAEPEWFGGPVGGLAEIDRAGVGAAEVRGDADQATGGASASW